jgi:eukaryotic-like serine/threonine-protein kinase
VKPDSIDAHAARRRTPLPDWKGTSRYGVTRCIGAGGMGVVYEAFDRERSQLVALKTLLRFSPAALYRFKQEFRTLTDVVHPNLVSLYELVATDAHVFFTMELVQGVDFLTYVVRPGARAEMAASRVDAPTRVRSTTLLLARSAVAGPSRAAPPIDVEADGMGRSPADFERLRSALRQLVAGVSALHGAGKLHRDIKPSNVLVTPEGRVVLLDFGVATDVALATGDHAGEREIVGTAQYTAPEQVGDTATTQSDWYSVGVMLYKALVGHLPFAGPDVDVLTRKALCEPPRPSEFVHGIPGDLEELCCALLRPAPEARPSGAEIQRRLDHGRHSVPTPLPEVKRAATPLVGRAAHQRTLREAFDTARQGRVVTVRVHGASGMGKSVLLQRFLDELVERGEAATLRGRTYERESMPYKALDSVIDALSRYLIHLSEQDPSTPLPLDLSALVRLFPVLRRVDRIGAMAESAGSEPAHVVRRRAVAALRELLAGLAARQPLVICIDDVQWGDVDSAGLLVELVRPPFEAALLIVLSYREEEADSNSFLVETSALWPLGTDVRDLPIGPLEPVEAREMALSFLGPEDANATAAADAIARESGGSPLLVEELSRGIPQPGRVAAVRAGAIRLQDIVDARVSLLPDGARLVLELVALSVRPLPVVSAGLAAEIDDGLDEIVNTLRVRRFARTGFRGGREVLEIAHDRICQAIVARISEETVRAHHGRIARALEQAGSDPETLAPHLLGAGMGDLAAKYAEQAAESASAKLAFGQAVRLYRLALDAVGETSADARRLRMGLVDALDRAGRGAEAARVYAAAAAQAQGLERMELERSGAEELLLSGHVEEGAAALDRILDAAHIWRPRTLVAALAVAFVYRALVFVRGLRLPDRDPRDVRREDHLRIEALYAVVVGFSFVNVIYGMCAQARHLFLTLRAGDRFQVFRAAVVETTNSAARGGPEGKRERMFADIVQRLTETSDDPKYLAFGAGVHGQRMFLHGRWREARELLDGLYERFRGSRAGWFANWHLFHVYALGLMGELAEARRRCATLIPDAEARGDLYTLVNLRIGHCATVWLAADDIDGARRNLRDAMASWSQSGFFLQHYRAMLAEANVDLYAGLGESAYGIVARDWDALRRSFLMDVQYVRADANFLRARCALALAAATPGQGAGVAEAARFARKLDRERMPWTAPLAALVWAGVCHAKDDNGGAIAHLRTAIESGEAADMRLHSAVARMRLGAILGGTEGETLLREAREWMAMQEVRVPDRMAAMLAPGFAPDDAPRALSVLEPSA